VYVKNVMQERENDKQILNPNCAG